MVNKNCSVCGKTFSVKRCRSGIRKTCSRTCMATLYKTTLRGENNPNYRGTGEKVCKFCAKQFHTEVKSRMFCSFSCYSKNRVTNKKPKKKKIAKYKRTPKPKVYCICGGRIFASIGICRKCEFKKSLPFKICSKCGLKYKIRKCQVKKKYCSEKCRTNDLSGKQNPNYRGGIMSENKKIRSSNEYKEWRIAVFQRDGYTCQHCGQVGGKLNADHIKQFALYPELRLNIDNGRTLCVECHKKTSSYLSNKAYWEHKRQLNGK